MQMNRVPASGRKRFGKGRLRMILGIDVGGTAVKLGVLNRDGTILDRYEAPVNGDGYATPVLTSVLRASLAPYNTLSECEAFVKALRRAIQMLR